ncbi:trypsin-like peptidase domain-containing protein [Candidatus Gracilibacteria bacterium]|nr:trypsin-like peptidase domain-containing protein [Candidatus Gracilibacteria bacterium]
MLDNQRSKPGTDANVNTGTITADVTKVTVATSPYPHGSFEMMSLAEKKQYLAQGINGMTRDLGRGMSGDDVLMLQNALLILGYMTVAPNGNFGPKTEDALARFKLKNNLATDPNDIKTKRFGGNTKTKIVEMLLKDIELPVMGSNEVPEHLVQRVVDLKEKVDKLARQKIVTRQRETRVGVLGILLPVIIGLVGGRWIASKYAPEWSEQLVHKFFPELDPKNKKSNPSPEPPNPFFPGHKPPAPPVEPPKETFDKKIEKLLGDNALRKKLEEATVLLEIGAKKEADGNTYVSSCAGFIVDRQTILTARHCLVDDGAEKIKTLDAIIGLEEGGQLSRKPKSLWPVPGHGVTIATSGNTDFGLIRFDKPYFNKSRVLDITNTPPTSGEPYAIMGHPMGVPWKMEGAMFQGALREDPRGRPGSDGVKRLYELLGETHGGNSGGPITNTKGEVIGIEVASTITTFSDQKAYAVPLDQAYVQNMIHELLDEKPTPSTPKKENPGEAPKPKKKLHTHEMKKHQKGAYNPRSKSIEDLLKKLERQKQEQRLNRWGY